MSMLDLYAEEIKQYIINRYTPVQIGVILREKDYKGSSPTVRHYISKLKKSLFEEPQLLQDTEFEFVKRKKVIGEKSRSGNYTQLLQEIDWKMSRIEFILQQVSVDRLIEEAYEIHEMLIKVSQLLLILPQDLKMIPLAKGLSFQLQSIQEQYNRLFSKGEIPLNISE
ncbi:hypothetical protein ACQKIW_31055 [Bacillus thuringiensis]|uniref:hypothetical protein n=1 Tax=Bacillus thuringiensis TaxID=1428 RepID=UPI003D063BCF